MEMGLITRCWDILYLAPPLVVTPEEIDHMVEIIDHALGWFEEEVGVE